MQIKSDEDFMPQNEEIRNRIYELFLRDMHPNAVAHELSLDPGEVWAAFVAWRSGK